LRRAGRESDSSAFAFNFIIRRTKAFGSTAFDDFAENGKRKKEKGKEKRRTERPSATEARKGKRRSPTRESNERRLKSGAFSKNGD
jgi:hypothetical protein